MPWFGILFFVLSAGIFELVKNAYLWRMPPQIPDERTNKKMPWFGILFFVLSAGIEPTSHLPQRYVLSIELWKDFVIITHSNFYIKVIDIL